MIFNLLERFKWIVQPNILILSLITHPHVIFAHKLRYFRCNQRAFWPSIDSNATTTFKTQKGGKDIVKIVHVTSVVQHSFYEATIMLFLCKENKNDNFNQQFIIWSIFFFVLQKEESHTGLDQHEHE